MRPTLKLLLMPAALLILSGCQPPASNPALLPVLPVQRWVRGTARVEQSKGDLTATLAFEAASPGSLRFYLEVANRGGKPVLVTPEKVSCLLYDDADGTTPSREVAAVDPEIQLKAVTEAESREAANQATNTGFRGLFLLADLTDMAANTGKRSAQENRQVQRDRRETYRDLDSNDQRSDAHLSALAADRQRWEEQALRRNTVEPGQGVRGNVVFHVNTVSARKVRIRIPVEDAVLEFDFRPL